jgi:hypothetical protein
VVLAVTPARAQVDDERVPVGSRIARALPRNVTERPVEFPEVRLVQARLAECVVKKRPVEARTFVLQYRNRRPDDAAASKLIKLLADGNCLMAALADRMNIRSAELALPGDTMQYILSDALIRAELSAWPVLSDLKRAAPLNHPVMHESDYVPEPGKKLKSAQLKELAKGRTQEVERIYLSQFGECVVRANPAGAHRLVSSAIGSTGEREAISALAGTFKTCLLDDQTIVLNKTLTRGAVTLNYYRLAYALKDSVASAGTRH